MNHMSLSNWLWRLLRAVLMFSFSSKAFVQKTAWSRTIFPATRAFSNGKDSEATLAFKRATAPVAVDMLLSDKTERKIDVTIEDAARQDFKVNAHN